MKTKYCIGGMKGEMMYQYSNGQQSVSLSANEIRQRIQANPKGQHWIHQRGWRDWKQWREVSEFADTLNAGIGHGILSKSQSQQRPMSSPATNSPIVAHYKSQQEKTKRLSQSLHNTGAMLYFFGFLFVLLGCACIAIAIDDTIDCDIDCRATQGVAKVSVLPIFSFAGTLFTFAVIIRGLSAYFQAIFDTSLNTSPLSDAQKKEFYQ